MTSEEPRASSELPSLSGNRPGIWAFINTVSILPLCGWRPPNSPKASFVLHEFRIGAQNLASTTCARLHL